MLYAHISEPPPSVTERRSELPPQIDEVIARGMAKQPDDRYPSAGELVADAGAAFGGETAAPTALRPQSAPPAAGPTEIVPAGERTVTRRAQPAPAPGGRHDPARRHAPLPRRPPAGATAPAGPRRAPTAPAAAPPAERRRRPDGRRPRAPRRARRWPPRSAATSSEAVAATRRSRASPSRAPPPPAPSSSPSRRAGGGSPKRPASRACASRTRSCWRLRDARQDAARGRDRSPRAARTLLSAQFLRAACRATPPAASRSG